MITPVPIKISPPRFFHPIINFLSTSTVESKDHTRIHWSLPYPSFHRPPNAILEPKNTIFQDNRFLPLTNWINRNQSSDQFVLPSNVVSPQPKTSSDRHDQQPTSKVNFNLQQRHLLRRHRPNRKPRTSYSVEQLIMLECKYKKRQYLNAAERVEFAVSLGLDENQVSFRPMIICLKVYLLGNLWLF